MLAKATRFQLSIHDEIRMAAQEDREDLDELDAFYRYEGYDSEPENRENPMVLPDRGEDPFEELLRSCPPSAW